MSSTALTQYWGLLRRRTCWLPTLRGWLLLLILFRQSVLIFGFRNAYTFLAVNDPMPDGVLVVEGWSPDYALEIARSKAQESPNHKLYVVGGPLEHGAPLSEYKTYAELGAATLLRMGMSSDTVQTVPAPFVRKDRTYAAAIALRNWFREHGDVAKTIDLISVGAHSPRHYRLMFEKAFSSGTRVGVMDIERSRLRHPPIGGNPAQGVRSVC